MTATSNGAKLIPSSGPPPLIPSSRNSPDFVNPFPGRDTRVASRSYVEEELRPFRPHRRLGPVSQGAALSLVMGPLGGQGGHASSSIHFANIFPGHNTSRLRGVSYPPGATISRSPE